MGTRLILWWSIPTQFLEYHKHIALFRPNLMLSTKCNLFYAKCRKVPKHKSLLREQVARVALNWIELRELHWDAWVERAVFAQAAFSCSIKYYRSDPERLLWHCVKKGKVVEIVADLFWCTVFNSLWNRSLDAICTMPNPILRYPCLCWH